MKSRARWPPATARCWWSTPRRASKRRASPTATRPPSSASKWCRSSTRSTCRRPIRRASSRKSKRSSASRPTVRSWCPARRARASRNCIEQLIERIPQPKGDPEAPLQALIVDSWFDNYVGVVTLVRIFNGTLKVNDKIRVMSTGRAHQVDKMGRFTPKSVAGARVRPRRRGLRHRGHQGNRRRAGRRHHHARIQAGRRSRCRASSRSSRACSPACSRSSRTTTTSSAMR